MDEDPHAVLGVPTGVTRASLKRAFRRRARATHPDHGGDRYAFEAAVSAYRTLLADTRDDRQPKSSAWSPYAPVERHVSTFSAYDSRRRTPRPAAEARPDDFDVVLARAMAAAA